MIKTGLVLAAVVAGTCAPACAPAADAPPTIVIDESVCDHCTMLISEPRYAAAYRIDGRERVFDDIGCLLEALADESAPPAAQVWFRDVDDGRWLSSAEAVFVHSASLPTPMAGGVVATGDAAAAAALGKLHDGTVYPTFDALLVARPAVAGHDKEKDNER